MPIYEYCCDACRHCFEALIFASDGAPTCPKCGSDKVQRQLSSFATGGGGKSLDLGGLAPAPSSGGCGSGGFS